MKEITVKEFIEAVSNGVYAIESDDTYGIRIEMSRAKISYDEEYNELAFVSAACNNGVSVITFNVEDSIESISVDDESGIYTIEFKQYMSDVEVRRVTSQ